MTLALACTLVSVACNAPACETEVCYCMQFVVALPPCMPLFFHQSTLCLELVCIVAAIVLLLMTFGVHVQIMVYPRKHSQRQSKGR